MAWNNWLKIQKDSYNKNWKLHCQDKNYLTRVEGEQGDHSQKIEYRKETWGARIQPLLKNKSCFSDKKSKIATVTQVRT